MSVSLLRAPILSIYCFISPSLILCPAHLHSMNKCLVNECVEQNLLLAGAILKTNIASCQDKVTETKLFSLLKEKEQKTQTENKNKNTGQNISNSSSKDFGHQAKQSKNKYPERCETKEVSPVTVPAAAQGECPGCRQEGNSGDAKVTHSGELGGAQGSGRPGQLEPSGSELQTTSDLSRGTHRFSANQRK